MIRPSILATATLAAALLAACDNHKYTDLMTVSRTCDAEIDGLMANYEKSTDETDRGIWRDRIVTLRKKQLIMMQRIDIETMPKVKTGELTREAAAKEREALIAAAQKRFDEASALKVSATAAAPAPAAAPATKP